MIKSILCSGLLLLLYHFFLEQEKMHRFNRFYLLLSIAVSVVIPLLTIEMEADILPQSPTSSIPFAKFSETGPVVQTRVMPELATEENMLITQWPFLVYSLVCIILLARLLRNSRAVLATKSNRKAVYFHGARIILLPKDTVTYTFLNNIFVTESAFCRNQIEHEVLTHELAHVRQKHTLDVLFIELLRALFWINPLWFFYKKAIQLNHEFLADDAVLDKYNNQASYKLLLLDKILYTRQLNLTSSFNYSITKKRLTMMTKTTSPARGFVKQSITVVLSIGLAFLFCGKIYSQHQRATAETKPQKKIFEQKSGTGLTQEEMAEFINTIEKHTVFVTNNKGRIDPIATMPPKMEDRMYDLYTRMNKEQKKQQHDAGIMLFQMDIPVKKSPTPEMFEKWKIPTIFGVWINNKRVPNSELDKYKFSDIAEYDLSKLYGGALKGRIYKYQLDLLTNDYFDKTFEKRANDRVIITRRGTFEESAKK